MPFFVIEERTPVNHSLNCDEADQVDGRLHYEEVNTVSVQETKQDENGRDRLDAVVVARQGNTLTSSPVMSTSVYNLPGQVYKQICEQLNIRRAENFDDFRMLAEKVGFSREEIRHFESRPDPTHEVLKS